MEIIRELIFTIYQIVSTVGCTTFYVQWYVYFGKSFAVTCSAATDLKYPLRYTSSPSSNSTCSDHGYILIFFIFLVGGEHSSADRFGYLAELLQSLAIITVWAVTVC